MATICAQAGGVLFTSLPVQCKEGFGTGLYQCSGFVLPDELLNNSEEIFLGFMVA